MASKRSKKPPTPPQPPSPPEAGDLLQAFSAPPCSFCGRTPLEHDGLQFQKGPYQICADCVRRMHRELNAPEPAPDRGGDDQS